MALSIKSERADRLARELAATTGESITEATTVALEERLLRQRRRRSRANQRRVATIIEEFRKLPLLDERPVDELLGYDQDGLPR